MAIITLLTDFGVGDEYVGVLKGVILGINPRVRIVDLTHGIEPQDVVQAAYTLASAFPYFPQGTIHVAVVDPCVGSERAVIASAQNGHLMIAPDNGLLSVVWDQYPPDQLVRVDNGALFLNPVSRTFHGRDIFAPVAAHLSLGIDLARLGCGLSLADVVRLPVIQATLVQGLRLVGQVVSVDHFGNLVTNVSAGQIEQLQGRSGQGIAIHVNGRCIIGLSLTYAQAEPGQLVALIGSRNYLEIAVCGGSAARYLNSAKGTAVWASLTGST